MGLADPAALERLAGALERRAADLRRAADPYARGARTMAWSGVAARGFQDRAQADVAQINSMADRLVRLAAMIRRGAQDVRQEIERRRREAEAARQRAESTATGPR